MRIGTVDLVQTGKQLVTETLEDDVPGLAAELAYRFFLALFPFFIFLAALGGVVAGVLNVANPTDRVMGIMEARLPADAASVIRSQLEGVVQSRNPGLLSFGLLAAIWAASSAFKAVMKAMNRAYDVEESRSFWKKYLIGIGLTLLAGTAVIGAFVLLVAGQFLAGKGAEAVGLSGAWGTVLDIIRWPVALMLVMVAMAFLYWAAPNIGLPFKWITPGAVLFTLVWLVATLLFGWYVSTFANYNATYGALGGVVVLLLWFYITGLIMLVGAELNAIVDEQVEPETVQAQRAEKQAESGKAGEEAQGQRPGSGAAGRPAAVAQQVAAPAGRTSQRGAALTVVAGEARRLGERLFVASEMKVTPVPTASQARVTRNGETASLAEVRAGDWVVLALNPDGTVRTLDAMDDVTARTPKTAQMGGGTDWARLAGLLVSLVAAVVGRGRRAAAADGRKRAHTRARRGSYPLLRRKPSR